MKIAFLIQDISTEGGTERTTCCLAQELARRGHEVTVVSAFHTAPQPYYTASGVNFIYLTREAYTLRESALERLHKLWRLRGVLRSCMALQEADIIICQKIAASFMAWIAGWGRKSIACEHYRFSMYNALLRRLRTLLYSRLCAVVTLTENDRLAFCRAGLKRVFCIPNMISITPRAYKGQDSNRIISVGRLTAQKGYDLLLRALAIIGDKMAGYQVEIYGEGEERAALEAQCQQMGLSERVHFCGYSTSIETVYASSAFYVMSSRFEGFPMVLLEAAASGLPIVSFDCPEGPAVMLREGGGLLVPKENISALAEAILRMMTDSDLRRLCHEQSARIVAPYMPQKIATQWEQLIEELRK